jgi:cyclase
LTRSGRSGRLAAQEPDQTQYAGTLARRSGHGQAWSIIAKIKPGAEEKVAEIFAESDRTELPKMTGVRHRSLFVLEDVYVHLVEMEDDFDETVAGVRNHELFRDISKKLEPYIQPYNPATWRSPKDATAREFYNWDPE